MARPEFASKIDASAADLFALLNSPFERDFEAFGYQARLHLPVSPDAKLFYDNPAGLLSDKLPPSKLDSSKDWIAEAGYLPQETKLGFTRLELPLKTALDNEALVLQRVQSDNTPQGYFIPLQRRGDIEEEFTSPREEHRGVIHMIPASFVATLLARAGYGLPELFTSPNDLKLHMADFTGAATKWATQETVVIPEDPLAQTTITRTLSQRPNSRREEIDVQLSSTSELISQDGTQRQQLIITFEGNDYSVAPPTISVRELRQTNSILGVPGSETYEIIKDQNIKVTSERIEALAAMMVDSMIGK